MLLRLLVGLSGPAYTLAPGDEREFSQSDAVRLIEAGFAIPVAESRVERPEDRLPALEVRDALADAVGQRRRGRPRKRS